MPPRDVESTNTLGADVIVNIVFGIIATVLAVGGIVAAVRFRGQRAPGPQAGASGRGRGRGRGRSISQGTHFSPQALRPEHEGRSPDCAPMGCSRDPF